MPSGVPDWQIDASIDFSRGPFSTQLRAHWFTDGSYDNTMIGPDDPRYSITLPNSINDNTLPGRMYLHWSAQYEFSLSNGIDMEVYGVVNNLTNEEPPPAPSSIGGYNPTLYDPLGRAYRVGVRMNF